MIENWITLKWFSGFWPRKKKHSPLIPSPKTNIARENGWLEDKPFLSGRLIFRGELWVSGSVNTFWKTFPKHPQKKNDETNHRPPKAWTCPCQAPGHGFQRVDFQSNAISFLSCGIFFRAGHPPRCSRKEGLGTRPWEIRLMEEILHQLTGSFILLLKRFYTSQVVQDFIHQPYHFCWPWDLGQKIHLREKYRSCADMGQFPRKICYKRLVSPPPGSSRWKIPQQKKGRRRWKWYCWWTQSCTTKDDDYPTIYRVLAIPGSAGFLPSTVPKSQCFIELLEGFFLTFEVLLVDNWYSQWFYPSNTWRIIPGLVSGP